MSELRNTPIVCVALPSWEGEYTKSTVHLMTRLAEHNRVLYVDYPRTWTDVVRAIVRRAQLPWKAMFSAAHRVSAPLGTDRDLHLLTLPPVLPVNALPSGRLYRWGQALNARIISRAIRQAMASLDMEAPVVINAFQPGLGLALKGTLGERSTVYYCYDEISEATWCGKHGAEDERRFIEEADVVITTSDALWESKERHARQCFVVKNGVDFDLFSSVDALRAERLNADGIPPNPVIGFVGNVDARVDLDLLETVARMRPEWTFEIVGPARDPEVQARLAAVDNLVWHGSKGPADLPAIMQRFDAGIIPFRKDGFTRFIYPIKVNEYLAAGLPVVMTDFAHIPELRAAVEIADEAETFVAALERVVRRQSVKDRDTRRAFASLNSWQARSARFASVVARFALPVRPARLFSIDAARRLAA